MKDKKERKTKLVPSTKIRAQDLKNLKVYELAMAGNKTQSEIGEEVGLSRQQVNTILNSDQSRQLIEAAKARLISLQEQAVSILQRAMTDYPVDSKTAVQAATTVLKGTGVLTEKLEIDDSKPFIIQFINGEQVHLGIKAGKE